MNFKFDGMEGMEDPQITFFFANFIILSYVSNFTQTLKTKTKNKKVRSALF